MNEGLIATIDQLAEACSVLNGCGELYCTDTLLQLDRQDNYNCLLGFTDDHPVNDMEYLVSYSRFVKQRSDNWHKLRQLAKVTGSTMYKALGLDT